MKLAMRLGFWSFGLSLLGAPACIDLTPDVGDLHTSATNGDSVEPRDGGENSGGDQGNGSSGKNNGGNDPQDAGGSNDTSGNNDASNNGANANGGTGTTGESDASLPEPDAGPPDNGCAIKDSDPGQSVSFGTDVWMILEGCRCHNSSDADPFGILESGLTIDGYASLRKGGSMSKASIIVDGNPCESIILHKLGESPPFGERMPFDGPYLTDEQRQLISDWIVEGARDN